MLKTALFGMTFFVNFLFSFDLNIISFRSSFVIKALLLCHSIFFFTGACLFNSIKVARVVNLKLFLTERSFYTSIILITLCKIRYLNLDKSLLFPKGQVICLKNWKLWRTRTTLKFNIFCWNFAHVSYLTMSTKGCSAYKCLQKGVLLNNVYKRVFGNLFILFRTWVINENVKNEV